MPAPSAEALLISALINNEAMGEEIQYGISTADFEGYSSEYNWLTNYVETYGCQPNQDIFKHKFTDFPLSTHENVRSAAEAVHQSSNRRRITTAITEAMDHLHLGDADTAHQILADASPTHAAGRPRKVLVDYGHLDEWGQKPYCVELPYPSLQRFTGGIRAGNLWYVAGRPAQGKSAHIMAFAKHAIMTGNRALVYSLEMSEEEVRARFHASLASRARLPHDHPDQPARPTRWSGTCTRSSSASSGSGCRAGVATWTCTPRRTGR